MKGFKGGGGGGLQQLMKQANQMQNKMKKLQAELAERTYEAAAGGGAVSVKVNGDYQLTAVKIDAEVFKEADAEMLQDLILAATNEALKNSREANQKEMDKVTGGFGMPGMF